MTLTTILIFLIVLGVIVFVHELGHFSMAKLFGVKVDEFGLGFPPKIIGKKIGETEYTLNWIPLGGFVKIMGEDGENRSDPRSFGSKKIWQRALILSAGVIMNFLLAVALFSFIFLAKFPQDVTGVPADKLPSNIEESYVQINGVVENSPASEARLAPMDRILQINDYEISKIEEFQNYTAERKGETVSLKIQRGEDVFEKNVLVRADHPEGAVGISLSSVAVAEYSLFGSIKEGFAYAVNMSEMIVVSFYQLLADLLYTGSTDMQVSGPVGIVNMTEQAAQLGLLVLLNFTALISINLAIINILPFPALDGGRIVFLLVEKVKGKPVSQEFEAKIHSAGFMLLMLLMVVVTFQDVINLGIWGKITDWIW
jgi:regulator of sigma E protease